MHIKCQQLFCDTLDKANCNRAGKRSAVRKLAVLFANFAFGCLLLASTGVAAQEKKNGLDGFSALGLKALRTALMWDEPAEPARIVGPIYFVGTKGLASFLITGSEGHVLLYTGMPGSGEMIEKSIIKLGFKPKDVRIILTCHAHCDHVGGHAYLKKVTGAKIAMMREEVELFESGGKLDFQYGDFKAFAFEPTKVDTVVRDEDQITLGDITIRALLTPGHTKGSTTYVLNVLDDGKTYTVVFPDGTTVNPGYRVGRNPSYKGIDDDYCRTFRVLEKLKPDIWLAPHNEFYGLDAKLARAATEGVKAWVDPDGFRKWLAEKKQMFETIAEKEREPKPATTRQR
jgi:metallo-beta-lactamase class B